MLKEYFHESKSLLNEFISEEQNFVKIEKAARIIFESIQNGGKIISCGNGGSHCDAMHFAEELSGRFRGDRKSLPAIAISDPSFISCVSNDYGYDFVFSRFIQGLGNPNDILLAISTSGNSTNVLNAIYEAKQKGMKVIGLTGKNGGKMAEQCDVEIRAPYSDFADHAQEIHIKIIHALILLIESYLE